MLICPELIDYSKYKRIFIFGCSFTNYWWPTWANILHCEMPEATCYNFGQSGGGNQFISATLVAANQKYKFNQYDLVIPHWSTYCREDRYIQTGWLTPGNIWTQGTYDDEFLQKYACAKGYLVRDLAIITATMYMLQQLPSDYIMLQAVPATYDSAYFKGQGLEEVVELYSNVLNSMLPSLWDLVCPLDNGGNKYWVNGHEYYNKHHNNGKGAMYQDYHPNPLRYLDYLEKLGFDISQPTRELTAKYNAELLALKTHDDLMVWHNNLAGSIKNYYYHEHLI